MLLFKLKFGFNVSIICQFVVDSRLPSSRNQEFYVMGNLNVVQGKVKSHFDVFSSVLCYLNHEFVF